MNMDVNSLIDLINKLDDVSSVDCTNSVLSLVVDASDALKKYFAFTKYWSDLYGTGLQVSGWHLNGALEDFDNFYDSAMECNEDTNKVSSKRNRDLIDALRNYACTSYHGKMGQECVVEKEFLNEVANRLELCTCTNER